MRFCVKCGAQLGDDVKFCGVCGAAVENTASSDITEAPAQQIQPETPVQQIQPETPAQQYQPEAPMQQFERFQQYQPSEQPKKKSKAGLIAGVSAAAVVVAGGGIAGYAFRNDITRMTMGDVAYAKMVEQRSYKPVEDAAPDSDAIEKSLYASLESAVSVMKLSSSSASAGNGAFASMAESITEFGEDIAMGEDPDWQSAQSGPLEGLNYSQIIELCTAGLPEGKGVSAEYSLGIHPKGLLAAVNTGTVKDALDFVNSLTLKAETVNGGTDKIMFGVSDGSGSLGSAEVFSDGTGILIALPEITDKVFWLENEGEGADLPEAKEKYNIDKDEISRIENALKDIYYKSFDSAQISFTKDRELTVTAADADSTSISVKGRSSSVTFGGKELEAMLGEMSDFLKNDEYLTELYTTVSGMSAEDYKNRFSEIKDINGSLTVENITDEDSNVLAKRYIYEEQGQGEIQIALGKLENITIVEMNYSAKEEKQIRATLLNAEEDSKNGRINVSFTDGEKVCGVDCFYSDIDKAKWLGQDIVTGTVSLKLAENDQTVDILMEEVNGLLGTSAPATEGVIDPLSVSVPDSAETGKAIVEAVAGELKHAKLTFVSSVEADTYNSGMSFELGSLGTVELNAKLRETGDTAVMPDKSAAIVPKDADSLSVIEDDMFDWLKKIAGRNEFLASVIGGPLGEIEKKRQEEGKYKAHYADYEKYTSESYADDTAYELYYDLDDIIAGQTDKNSREPAVGTIKLWFDADGKCTVIDDGGINGVSCDDIGARNTYAEIFFDSRYSGGSLGAVAVLTDSKDDLPSKLPGEFNFVDGVFEWEDYDTDHYDSFVIGTQPYLSTGTPTTDGSEWEQQNNGSLSDDIVGTWRLTDLDGQEVPEDVAEESGLFIYVTDEGTLCLIDDLYDIAYDEEKGGYIILEDGEDVGVDISAEDGVLNVSDDVYSMTFIKTSDDFSGYIQVVLSKYSPDYGEPMLYPDVGDIKGEWFFVSGDSGDYHTFTVSQNYILAVDGGDHSGGKTYFLNPSESGFDVYSDITAQERAGFIGYSKETDTLKLAVDDIAAVASKDASASDRAYNGEWKLTEKNGESAGESDAHTLSISDYDLIMTNSEAVIVEGLFAADGTGFFTYTEVNGYRQYIYDEENDVLIADIFTDNGDTMTLKYERG